MDGMAWLQSPFQELPKSEWDRNLDSVVKTAEAKAIMVLQQGLLLQKHDIVTAAVCTNLSDQL